MRHITYHGIAASIKALLWLNNFKIVFNLQLMAATLGTGIDIGNGSENIFAAAGNCWQGGKIGTRRIGTALSLSITPYFGGGKPIVTFLFLATREKQVGQGT